MLPNTTSATDLLASLDESNESTKTFAVNTTENIMGGTIDGVESLKQSIYFMLSTESDQFIIYPYTYGLQTLDLIGKPSYYVMAVLPERVKTCLLQDDRITEVSDFEFEVNKNKLHVSFIVHTIYGVTKENVVVNY